MKLSAEEQARYDEMNAVKTNAWNKAFAAYIKMKRCDDITQRADLMRNFDNLHAEYCRLHDLYEPSLLPLWLKLRAVDDDELAFLSNSSSKRSSYATSIKRYENIFKIDVW